MSLQLESCIIIANRQKYFRFHVKGRCHKHPEGGRGGVCTGSSSLRESFENRFVCISPVKNPFENRFVCISSANNPFENRFVCTFLVKNPFENRFVCIFPVKDPFENPFGSRFTLWPALLVCDRSLSDYHTVFVVQLWMIRFISINDTRSQQTLLSIPFAQQRHLLEEFFS